MRARALLAAAACVAALLAGVAPAAAHDESEAENGPLEVEARPAVAQIGNPVHIKAEWESDDDDESDDDESDDDESDDDESNDAELEAASMKTGEDESDDACDDDELEAATKTDDETAEDCDDDERDDACDDDELEAATKTDDDCDVDADETEAATTVAFTVDFGDGSEPVTMEVHGDKRRSHKAKAKATHRYDAEGDYEVTVTATPEGGDAVETTVVVSVGRGSARLDGEDRIATALRISRDSFDDGAAGAVLLARSDGFADALASATLALAEEAPVLLLPSSGLPADVQAEIERVLTDGGRVYLLGGEAAIASDVADSLAALGYDVVRVAGDDRVATSVAIAQFLIDAGADVSEVVLASATTFPDALAGAAYAAQKSAPVLLTAPDALSDPVLTLLQSLGTDTAVTVVGGTAGVSDAVVDELVAAGFAVERLAGDDRYDTSVEIAEAANAHPTVVVIATGETFPDALAGGAYAGRLGAPLLLVGDDLPDGLEEYLRAHVADIKVLIVLGGGGAVPQPVMERIEAALGL